MSDDITTDDIESTYKVLETIRDEWAYDAQTEKIPNEAHCIVQEFEADIAEQLDNE